MLSTLLAAIETGGGKNCQYRFRRLRRPIEEFERKESKIFGFQRQAGSQSVNGCAGKLGVKILHRVPLMIYRPDQVKGNS